MPFCALSETKGMVIKMNKSELVDVVAEKAGITKKETTKIINAFTEVVSEAIKERNEIRLVGFGTFKVRSRAARAGRNPKTGEQVEILAKEVPVFVPGKKLKQILIP